MRAISLLVIGGGVLLVLLQVVRPTIPTKPATAELRAPPEIRRVLEKDCYSCHSDQRRLAWFDEIVPAYWLVAHDVKAARLRLNFSRMASLPLAQQKATLYEAVNQIQLGAMPLAPYRRLHHAAVTPDQLHTLEDYLRPRSTPSPSAAADLAADDAQYEAWTRGTDTPPQVAPVANGIEFPKGYRDWQVISTTDRFDNGTIRAILGNDVAVHAIAANHTNPWPDGATFAKIAWLARADDEGKQRAGLFYQVEFMIRDGKKFAATKGWGWARWRSAKLTPYGKNAAFTEECVGCHAPVRGDDYVYTIVNRNAAPTGSLPWNPLRGKVIASAVDSPAGSMSTLLGNDIAIQHARAGSQGSYPAGSVVALVTWSQREDAHWFGGRIPDQVKSVEFVTVTAGPNNQPTYSYEEYEGTPLVRKAAAEDRTAYLLSLRAAVLP